MAQLRRQSFDGRNVDPATLGNELIGYAFGRHQRDPRVPHRRMR
jgi:hypothetical protein